MVRTIGQGFCFSQRGEQSPALEEDGGATTTGGVRDSDGGGEGNDERVVPGIGYFPDDWLGMAAALSGAAPVGDTDGSPRGSPPARVAQQPIGKHRPPPAKKYSRVFETRDRQRQARALGGAQSREEWRRRCPSPLEPPKIRKSRFPFFLVDSWLRSSEGAGRIVLGDREFERQDFGLVSNREAAQ